MRPAWRNGKHAVQWKMTLQEYASPIRRLPVGQITTDDVLSVLTPLWDETDSTWTSLKVR
jgi:hypothetical protein